MEKIIEIWKPIKGYENYEVSNLGNVKATSYTPHKILKQYLSKQNYYSVILWKNNKLKNFRVNRLVAEAFIDNPNNLPYVNHKDKITTNNIVTNLEWCTAEYNSNYGNCRKKMSENNGCNREVCQIDFKGNIIATYYNINEASSKTSINQTTIAQCCRMERLSAGTYLWCYSENIEIIPELIEHNKCVYIELNDGSFITVKQLSDITGIPNGTIRTRLARNKCINDFIEKYYEKRNLS